MGEENINGQMAENTQENTNLIKSKVLEFILGMMAKSLKGIGNKENNMGKAFIYQQMEHKCKVNGQMVKERDGQKKNGRNLKIGMNIYL